MSRLRAFLALISFTGAVLTELLFSFTGMFTHSIRVYPVECEGQVVFGTFCEGELTVPLNPSTFRAYPDRQAVIEWSDDGTNEYKRCTVKDYRNWQCTVRAAPNLLLQKTMLDGRLSVAMYDSTMSPKTNVNSWDMIYVSVWDWLRFDLEYEMRQRQPQTG
jgi:hypothetical protein